MQSPSISPIASRRVILLGASNLAIHLGTAIAACRGVWGEPLNIVAAIGHGRSYGQTSWVLMRGLPGILRSGLWTYLNDQEPSPTTALVTDIGNDLVYGASVEQVAAWVEECLERLAVHSRQIIVTQLPLDSIARLTPRRYALFRRLLFPQCRLDLETIRGRAELLSAQISLLAEKFQATLLTPLGDWYGFDPIHVRRSQARAAWQMLVAPWNSSVPNDWPPIPRSERWRLPLLAPSERYWVKWRQTTQQPCRRLRDGTTLAFF